VPPQSTTVTIGGNKITIGGKHYSPEELAQVKELIEKGDYIVLPNNEDVKIMYVCQKCGNEIECSEGVKFCRYCRAELPPECGASVEQKEKSQFWNEGIEHQTDIKKLKIDLDVITTDRNYWSRTAAQYKEENAALAKQNKEILVDRENYFVKALEWKEAHDKLQEKLRQKGIPWNVRRAMKQMYAHNNLENVTCCGILDKAGENGRVKCNECGTEFTLKAIRKLSHPVNPPWKCRRCEMRNMDDYEHCKLTCIKDLPHPAKPASLWKIRRKAEKENKSRLKEFNKMWKAMYRIGNYKEESITVGKFQFNCHTTENHWEFTHNDPWEFIGKVKGEDTKFDYPTLLKYKDEFWASLHKYYQNQLAGVDK